MQRMWLKINSTNISYNWTPIDGVISGLGTSSVTVNPTNSTSYSIFAINEYDCADSGIVNVDVLISEASFDSIDLLCNGSFTVPFTNTSQVSAGGFQWIFDTLGTSSDVNPTFTFSDTGLYAIQLISGIGTPCLDTTEQVIPLFISQQIFHHQTQRLFVEAIQFPICCK